MPERQRINPVHCKAKEAEYRTLSTDGELTLERRTRFLIMAETWASLAKIRPSGKQQVTPSFWWEVRTIPPMR